MAEQTIIIYFAPANLPDRTAADVLGNQIYTKRPASEMPVRIEFKLKNQDIHLKLELAVHTHGAAVKMLFATMLSPVYIIREFYPKTCRFGAFKEG